MGRRNPLRKWVASARRVKRTEKEAEWRGEGRRGEGGREGSHKGDRPNQRG